MSNLALPKSARPRLHVALLGGPGAGKGTIARQLAKQYALKHLSTGEILRREIAGNSPLGHDVEPDVRAGNLVEDAIVNAIVVSQIQEQRDACGIIYDGYPRTLTQAQYLDRILREHGEMINLAVLIDAPSALLLQRASQRLTCDRCGRSYGVRSTRPRQAGLCDQCGTPLSRRSDDDLQVAGTRLQAELGRLQPVCSYYAEHGRLSVVPLTSESGTLEISGRILAMVAPNFQPHKHYQGC